jgi:NAD(P)-dependent dehydrogenase (short-subunit alcohol dehydrogenase family)
VHIFGETRRQFPEEYAMTHWSKKTWLVTGASSGFGRAICEQVLARGGKVIATARDPISLAPIVARGNALALPLDVTRPEQIAAAFKRAESLGGVDVLVNNAGYGFLGGVEESADEEIRAVFEVNFFGAAAMMRAALPGMRAKRAGYVINVSSIAGIYGAPAAGYYSGTKFGLEGLSEALALEGEPLGIRTLIIELGAFRTNFFGRSIVKARNRISAYTRVNDTYNYADTSDGMQPGDPERAAAIVVDAIEGESPPRRLVLGLEAHAMVTQALRRRLEEADSQRDLALQACFPTEHSADGSTPPPIVPPGTRR